MSSLARSDQKAQPNAAGSMLSATTPNPCTKSLARASDWSKAQKSCTRHRSAPHNNSSIATAESKQNEFGECASITNTFILEIGVGPGANFVHYDPTKVSKVYALEPNRGMVRLAEQHRQQINLNIEFLDRPGERIPLEDASVDTVVSTFTLCTIPGVVDAVRGIGRVLRPSGKFIFFEHGLGPEPSTQRWQRWSEPIPHWLFEGCHGTRDIPSLISKGGFQIEQIETGYLARFSGALRRHNHNSAACSVLPRHKECRPIEAVVPSRRTTSTKPEIFRNLSPARMKGQSSSSVWVSLLGVVFVFLVVSGCDESVCVRYP